MRQIERIFEKHGKNEITLTVYGTEDGRFTFSLQCAVSRVIRAIYPHQLPDSFDSPILAKRAAVDMICSWTQFSRTAKEQLKSFDFLSCPYQLSLFSDEELSQLATLSSGRDQELANKEAGTLHS
jgi:hypothetical protein